MCVCVNSVLRLRVLVWTLNIVMCCVYVWDMETVFWGGCSRGQVGQTEPLWSENTHTHISTDPLTQSVTGLYRCCCGQQVAVCWSACLDGDNSRSITPWKLRSDHWADRATHSVSVGHPASTVVLKRITNKKGVGPFCLEINASFQFHI